MGSAVPSLVHLTVKHGTYAAREAAGWSQEEFSPGKSFTSQEQKNSSRHDLPRSIYISDLAGWRASFGANLCCVSTWNPVACN